MQDCYPRGLDVEVVWFRTLQLADAEAVETPEREHVMPFIWRRPERFPQKVPHRRCSSVVVVVVVDDATEPRRAPDAVDGYDT